MIRADRTSVAGARYLDLQRKARQTGRPTDELIQLYALECFLDRLTRSAFAKNLVLKGGVLLAALDARRPTRDIDLAASALRNTEVEILAVVREIAGISLEDGIEFDREQATAEVIREEHDYSGVRVTLGGTLSRAMIRLHVDVNVGDPIWPEPQQVSLPRLLDGVLQVRGYPLEMVLAEKVATAPVPPKPPEPDTQRYGYREPDPPPPAKKDSALGELLVAGERVGFRIEERYRDEPRTPTDRELAREKREYGYKALRKIAVPTGNLRVVRLDTYNTWGTPSRLTWRDRGNTHVESQLKEILLGFYELAQSIKTRRSEAERQRLEHEAAERRRKEYEARQEANANLIKQLETDAGAWHRARYLRRYIQAARRALTAHAVNQVASLEEGGQILPPTSARSGGIPVRFMKQTIDFLDWAEIYVNQLDPLSREPRYGEFQRSSYYVTDIDRIKTAFARLLGSEWPQAWKLGADYTPDPDHRYYGEKSVFEVEEGPED